MSKDSGVVATASSAIFSTHPRNGLSWHRYSAANLNTFIKQHMSSANSASTVLISRKEFHNFTRVSMYLVAWQCAFPPYGYTQTEKKHGIKVELKRRGKLRVVYFFSPF